MTTEINPTEATDADVKLAEYAADAEPRIAVKTDWASDERMEASESFDDDQADVNGWVNALPETREEALERTMTLADAEELIATCETVARQHEERAAEARTLAASVAQRLGRTGEKFKTTATVPKPVAAAFAGRPEGARASVSTDTRVMPTAGASK